MSMERPVNPGCIRIEDYQASRAPAPEAAPLEADGYFPAPVMIPPTAKNTDAEPESVFGSTSAESVALGEVCQPLLAIMLGNE